MGSFVCAGRIVEHLGAPRFRVLFAAREDGGFEAYGEAITWIDPPPRDARTVARLLREAGDYYARQARSDWVQEAVIARAGELGATAYAIAKASDGAVSEDHVRAYLTRRKSMGTHKLQHVLRVLGLTIAEGVAPPSGP